MSSRRSLFWLYSTLPCLGVVSLGYPSIRYKTGGKTSGHSSHFITSSSFLRRRQTCHIAAMRVVRSILHMTKTRTQPNAYSRPSACNLPMQKATKGTAWHVQGTDRGGIPPFNQGRICWRIQAQSQRT